MLRKRHERRTDAMMGFLLEQDTCRTRLLLRYFDEDFQENCGHCDICRKQQKTIVNEKELSADLMNKLKAGAANIHQLTGLYPAAIREDILSLVRKLADERMVRVAEDGTVSVI
jgi:ATP-dependent DNA helicase RecQ